MNLHIARIYLKQFRNLKDTDLLLNANVNIFWGMNGQGKTNLLEGIYLLAMGSSPRAFNDSEMICWNKDYFFVKGIIEDEHEIYTLSVGYGGGRKKINLNGQLLDRIKDLLGRFLVVYFTPEDLQLIKGPPGLRRRFFDQEISLLFPLYYDNLQRYRTVLQQRNNLLKEYREKKSSNGALEPWNIQLAALGAQIINKRIEVLDELRPILMAKYSHIADKDEILGMEYHPSLPLSPQASLTEWENALTMALERRQNEEIMRGTTLVGPHRDEVTLFLNGKELRNFGSQGQQRSAVLALKLAELEYIGRIRGKKPVLLLDDVFSELDNRRRAALIDTIKDNIQTIITTTDMDFKMENLSVSSFRVEKGTIVINNEKE